MPWKVNGERWHLGDKGFPPGKKVRWDRALLPRLLQLVREVEPGLRSALGRARRHHAARARRQPGLGAVADQESGVLDCHFLGKKGQFNLSQIEDLGMAPNIGTSARTAICCICISRRWIRGRRRG